MIKEGIAAGGPPQPGVHEPMARRIVAEHLVDGVAVADAAFLQIPMQR